MIPYSKDYYQKLREGSRQSAKEIIPLTLQPIRPRSVIDVGCGIGTWLSVFKEMGVEDFLGVDGNHVDREMLEIPIDRFLSFDLKQPFRLDRQFDLVVSLEVAEHLPSECAEVFVASLIKLGPVVLFSAAIPFQGGENHVNEQWPDYWAKYFQQKGYVAIDCIRKKIWQNSRVEWWYAQNALVFASMDYLETHTQLRKELESVATSELSLVHPSNYLSVISRCNRALAKQDLAAQLPSGERFILVDQEEFGGEFQTLGRSIPFLERDGCYWGPPADDITAIGEFNRLRQAGANYMVFGWPAFWWLEYYVGLNRYLRSQFRCMLENERLIVFDLRT